MGKEVNEVEMFCELVIATLGHTLNTGGFVFTGAQTEMTSAECHFDGPSAQLRFVYTPMDGEVSCLVRIVGSSSDDAWNYLTELVNYDEGMTDEKWAETVTIGPDLIQKVQFYDPLLRQLPNG